MRVSRLRAAAQRKLAAFRYPNERMFHSAMRRKGWPSSLEDLQTIVSIHSPATERAWSEVRAF